MEGSYHASTGWSGLRPIGKSSECCRMTVGTGKAQSEQMFSALPPVADLTGPRRDVSEVPRAAVVARVRLPNERNLSLPMRRLLPPLRLRAKAFYTGTSGAGFFK